LCCGFRTLFEKPPGTFAICPVCDWEDDDAQARDTTLSGGANRLSLDAARSTFLAAVAKSPELMDAEFSARSLRLIQAVLGRTVTGLSRVLYDVRGVIEPSDGALEVQLDGFVVLLDSAADGDRLRVDDQPWNDPFDEPLSRENRSFVESHGRWRRIDCSPAEPYSELVGRAVTEVALLENPFRRVAGVRLSAEGRSLWFVIEGDECHVYWAHPISFTECARWP
jgi:hypothetical protein